MVTDDQITRLRLMASTKGTKWDISPNDRDAIAALLIDWADRAPDSGSQARTSEAPDAVAGMKAVYVPAEFVIYKCKIGKGRVIDIPLPPEFTRSDVKRLHAFLETQVDDEDDVAT